MSNLPGEPADAADDVDLFGAALVGGVEPVVGDDADGGRVAAGDVFEPLGHQAHAVIEHEDAGRVGRAAGQIDQHGVAVEQGGRHAVARDMQDAKLGRGGLEAAFNPGAAEVVGAARRVLVVGHQGAAAHRGPGAGMGDRHEGLVGVLDERPLALDRAQPMDQPVALDLQNAGHIGQPVDAGARRPPAQDVVDEGSVHPGHFGDMGGAQAQLLGTGAKAVGEGVVVGHGVPKGLWIDWDQTGLIAPRQASRT